MAKNELGAVDPHRMHNDGEFAGDGNPRAGHASGAGDLHPQALSADHFFERMSNECAAS